MYVVRSLGWTAAEKIIRMSVGLYTLGLVAKQIGPGEFGQLNLLMTAFSFAAMLCLFGMDNVILKNLSTDSNEFNVVMTASFLIRFVVCTVFITVTISWAYLSPISNLWLLVFFIIPLYSVCFRAVEQKNICERRVETNAKLQMATFALGTALRLFGVSQSLNIEFFIFVFCLEFLCYNAFLAITFPLKNIFSPDSRLMAIAVLKESYPIFLISVIVYLYMKVDVFMLNEISGADELGYFGAAQRPLEALLFLPLTLSAMFFPQLLSSYNKSTLDFRLESKAVQSLFFFGGCGVSIFVWLFADNIVDLLYGADYAQSAETMRVFSLAMPFIFLQYIITKNLYVLSLLGWYLNRSIIMLAVKVILNLAFIPYFGSVGAGLSTCISFVLLSFVVDLIKPELRMYVRDRIGCMRFNQFLIGLKALRRL